MSREDGTISIEKVGTSYRAYFDYDKDFISWVKKDGHGSWNSYEECWVLPANGVINLLDQCDRKWFSIDEETLEAAKADAEKESSRVDGKINIERHNGKYRAYFAYDKDFVSWVKEDGNGRWDVDGLFWSLSPAGVLNLLQECDKKWIYILPETIEAAKQDVATEKAEAERIKQEKEAEEERIRKEQEAEAERRRQKIEDAQRREADYWATPAEQRLAGIKPIEEYDFKSTPYPHQIEAFNYILKRGKILVADEPGLGKTAESIYASDYIKKAGKAKKCLIVCGVNTIKYNWMDEIQKHSDQKAILIDGTEKKRLELIDQWKADDDIYYAIINIEALRKDTIFDELDDVAEVIICDEIHKAKNGRSKQGHALRCLKAPYKIGLTGTPVDNKVEDLYNILVWLDAEKRSFVDFRDAYCILDEWGSIVDYTNLGSLQEKLSKVMIRRKKSDVVDLPEKIYKTEYVELSKAEEKKYKELRDGILNDIDRLIDMDNPLSSIFHLKEVTGGLYTEDSENAKLARIKEIIEEEIIPAGKKAIVFSKYEKVAEIYKRQLVEYHPAYMTGSVSPEERQKEVERFQNNPDCKICIGTIGAMGTGITLTAASTVIFADKDWTVSANRQAEDRAHRIGTTENVNVITVVAKDTIDEYVEGILKDKELYTDLIMEGTDVVMDKTKRPQLIADLLGISEAELKKRVAKAKKENKSKQEKVA